jgi:hypothetical protein
MRCVYYVAFLNEYNLSYSGAVACLNQACSSGVR